MLATDRKQLTFTRQQLDNLAKLGLSEEQIRALKENHRLTNWAATHKHATMTAVRKELRTLLTHCERAQHTLSKIITASIEDTARAETLNRIEMESIYLSGDAKQIEDALRQLAFVSAITTRALRGLPKERRMDNSASSYPIELIAESLRCCDAPPPKRSSTARLRRQMRLMPSEAEGPFRELVGVCYEALGLKNTDPVRAIRAYIKRSHTHTNDESAAIATKAPKRKRGRPPETQRQVP